jgi:glucose-1-phosphate thymidylyltransferase
MKGVILAGGTGSRLRPLTRIINKHLLPVGRYPMIHYAIEKLAASGIDDIMLITGKQSAGLFVEYLGGGSDWKVRLTYKIQEEAGGIAHALALAEGFIGREDKFVLLLGDNLFEDNLRPAVDRFRKSGTGTATVFLKEVDDPRRYGVPILEEGRIIGIVEKPEQPPSGYSVSGIYMYDGLVFDIIRSIRPSDRGEIEITDVNNVYAADRRLVHETLAGWWDDAGTHQSLLDCANRLYAADSECD